VPAIHVLGGLFAEEAFLGELNGGARAARRSVLIRRGNFEDPDVDVLTTIVNLLRIAFVAAFSHSLVGSVNLRDVSSDVFRFGEEAEPPHDAQSDTRSHAASGAMSAASSAKKVKTNRPARGRGVASRSSRSERRD
jgi:hypothetical protein